VIVLHRERRVYVGVPKTASTALHAHLASRGGVLQGRQHGMDVPEELRGYRVFATAMNPYRRAWSLWRMLRGDAAKGARFTRRVAPEALASFPVFVREVLRGPTRIIPLYRWPVHRWLAELPAGFEARVIPVEGLDAGLRSLGLLGPDEQVPVRNVTKGDWLDAYDEEVAAAVRAWAGEDFERFGYATELSAWQRRARMDRLRARAEGLHDRVQRRLRRLAGRAEPAG